MAILQIEHGVRDFEAWKTAFDGDPIGREAGGVRRYTIYRPADNPNYVVVDLEFESRDEATAFGEKLRELWSARSADLGLEGASARVLEDVETHSY
jgi:hypothetical protein